MNIDAKLLEQGKPVFSILSPNDKNIKQFGDQLCYTTLHENEYKPPGLNDTTKVEGPSNVTTSGISNDFNVSRNISENELLDDSKLKGVEQMPSSLTSPEFSDRQCFSPLNQAIRLKCTVQKLSQKLPKSSIISFGIHESYNHIVHTNKQHID